MLAYYEQVSGAASACRGADAARMSCRSRVIAPFGRARATADILKRLCLAWKYRGSRPLGTWPCGGLTSTNTASR